MSRFVNVAIGQLGPIARHETRAQVVQRLSALMLQAHQMGCDLIVYPELALTTFFPRWYIEDPAELDALLRARDAGPADASPVRPVAQAGHRLLHRLWRTRR